jgi:hypothetical protein
MKYTFMEKLLSRFGVEKMCRALKVSRSGYYAFRGRGKSMREIENESLVCRIKEIHKNSRKTYGSPRVTDALKDDGVMCSKNRVERLMRINGIAAKTKRKFKAATDSSHNLPMAENLLNQQFSVDEPNKVWVSDITYIPTREGWLYLAVILDLFSRQVVGWAMSNRITQDIALPGNLKGTQKLLNCVSAKPGENQASQRRRGIGSHPLRFFISFNRSASFASLPFSEGV